MAYKQNSPREVTEGGTGNTSIMEYSVIVAGTTSDGALQNAPPGASGTLLISQGSGSPPAFATPPIPMMNFQVLASDPSAPETAQVWYNSTTDLYKGSQGGGVWSAGTNVSVAIRSLAAAGASFDDMIRFGGVEGAATGKTESYDGSTWSSGGSLNTARSSLVGAGTSSDALSAGGFDNLTTTERYNGTTWSAVTGLSTGRDSAAAAGADGGDVLVFGGNGASGNLNSTELYNGVGDSWGAKNNLNTTRRSLSGSGNSSSALSYGGDTGSDSGVTELFDLTGNTWTSKGSLNTARQLGGGSGYNDTSNALYFGGEVSGSVSAITEGYTLSTDVWAVKGSMGTARRNLAGAGTSTAAVSVAGFIAANSAVVEEYAENTIVTFTVT